MSTNGLSPRGSLAALEGWLATHIANWTALGTAERITWVKHAEQTLRAQAEYGVERPVFILDWRYSTRGMEYRYYMHREDFE